MAVALAKLQPPIIESRGLPWQAQNPGSSYALRKYVSDLVLNRNADFAKSVTSKVAYETALARSLENKKFWDELLEKLRRSGGGGGGSDKRFDRIAVSMMLTNFLRNKTIEAMIRNFNTEFGSIFKQIDVKIPINVHVLFANMQKIGNVILKGLTNIISLIIRRDAPMGRLYTVSPWMSSLATLLSFHLNKLKEILEEDLKGFLKNLDIKEKIKKIKEVLADFFIPSPFN